MSADRYQWIDRAKGFGISLVVYGHVARGLDSAGILPLTGFLRSIDTALYAFHMPLFFVLSGCLFAASWRRRGSARLLASKVDTIAYPYVVWSLLHGVLELAAGRWTNHATSVHEVLSFVWQPRIHFWYLHTLFLCFVVLGLCALRSVRSGLALGGLLAVCAWMSAPFFPLIAGVGPLILFFPFFVLGALHGLEPRVSVTTSVVLGLACATLFVIAQVVGPFPSPLGLADPATPRFTALSLALLGIAATCGLLIAPRVPGAKALEFLGRYALEIYILHVLAAAGVRLLCQKALGFSDPVTHLLLGTAAGIGVPVLMAMLIERQGWQWWWRAPPWLSLERRMGAISLPSASAPPP